MKRAIQALSAIVALLSCLVALQFQQVVHNDHKQTEAIRKILCFANHNTQTSKQRTPQEKLDAAKFYNQALSLIDAKPCPKELNELP